MVTYPLDKKTVLRNRSEAMRYLKLAKRDMAQRAQALQRDVLGLEDTTLRTAVAFIAEALAGECAHFDAKYLNEDPSGLGYGTGIHHLDIDDDILDAMEDKVGAEAVEEGGWWLLQKLRGESTVFISWAVGPVQFPENQHQMVLDHRVLYELNKRKFRAVLSHEDWNHPECMEYFVDGGKRKGTRFRRSNGRRIR